MFSRIFWDSEKRLDKVQGDGKQGFAVALHLRVCGLLKEYWDLGEGWKAGLCGRPAPSHAHSLGIRDEGGERFAGLCGRPAPSRAHSRMYWDIFYKRKGKKEEWIRF